MVGWATAHFSLKMRGKTHFQYTPLSCSVWWNDQIMALYYMENHLNVFSNNKAARHQTTFLTFTVSRLNLNSRYIHYVNIPSPV